MSDYTMPPTQAHAVQFLERHGWIVDVWPSDTDQTCYLHRRHRTMTGRTDYTQIEPDGKAN